MPNHWIFKVNDDSNDKYSLKGIQIYQHRLVVDESWGIKEKTKKGKYAPNVQSLNSGDKVIFYLCGQQGHCFLGTATLRTGFPLTNLIVHDEFLDWEAGVKLSPDKNRMNKRIPIEKFRGKLRFVPIGENYGSYLQGAITRITEDEFESITREY